MPTKKKPAAPSGGRKMMGTGRKPITGWFTPAEHRRVRLAAATMGFRSMAAFVLDAAMRAAEGAEKGAD